MAPRRRFRPRIEAPPRSPRWTPVARHMRVRMALMALQRHTRQGRAGPGQPRPGAIFSLIPGAAMEVRQRQLPPRGRTLTRSRTINATPTRDQSDTDPSRMRFAPPPAVSSIPGLPAAASPTGAIRIRPSAIPVTAVLQECEAPLATAAKDYPREESLKSYLGVCVKHMRVSQRAQPPPQSCSVAGVLSDAKVGLTLDFYGHVLPTLQV